MIYGRKLKLTDHQKREAIKRRDVDEETLLSIARSYNVSAATISRHGTAAAVRGIKPWQKRRRLLRFCR